MAHARSGSGVRGGRAVAAGAGESGVVRAAIVAWAAYPVVMSSALGLHLAMVRARIGVQASSSVAVALGVLLIVLLEAWHPYRRSWRAPRHEMKTDVVYLALVQTLLPISLALAVSGAFAHPLRQRASAGAALWPHAWSIAAQFLLVLAAADCAKYWLHVAAHRYAPLWRLHAVHHAPRRLHALNVARFHPIERTLQYLLETFPFVLLGVDVQVLALYVVFHSVHGFFQHANVAVRLGALNYVLSGPELHRWHHSRLVAESNANYANHLAVWDLVFGTYARPAARQVGDLGLLDEGFPTGFRAQLTAPFAAARAADDADRPDWRERAVNLLMRLRMGVLHWRAWRPLVAAARHPRAVQLALLRRILAAQRDTQFGRAHDFASIATYDDYRRRVPVQTYESLRPYIDAQERTGLPCLNAQRPVMYAQTSGTTGAPKYIPLPRHALALQKRSQNLFTYLQYRAVPNAYDGRLLAIVSPAVEGRLDTGTPFGSASGHLYESMPRLARHKYVIPPEVFAVPDFDLKYLLILRLALAEQHISAMGAANPSTFLHLLGLLGAHRGVLLADLEQQGFHRAAELPARVRRAIAHRLGCAPARVEELRTLLAREQPRFAELWPRLGLVTTWTGGSCGIALARLRAALPAATQVVELGYLASEMRGTVTFDAHANRALPTLRDTFFEFVEKKDWECEQPAFLTLDELEVGHEYYVLVTTTAGLYRYFMNDIVRVTGRFHATPTIAFVQKGKGVTSITGEKLYESQAIAAVGAAELDLGGASRFFLMLADVDGALYRLLIETDASFAPDPRVLAARVDHSLCERNVEYRHKRASGRLAPLAVSRMRAGFGEAYKRWCVAHGQREGQFKTIALQYASEVRFDYSAYRLDDGEEVRG